MTRPEPVEALAGPQWYVNRGHEYEAILEAFAAGRNEVIDELCAVLVSEAGERDG